MTPTCSLQIYQTIISTTGCHTDFVTLSNVRLAKLDISGQSLEEFSAAQLIKI